MKRFLSRAGHLIRTVMGGFCAFATLVYTVLAITEAELRVVMVVLAAVFGLLAVLLLRKKKPSEKAATTPAKAEPLVSVSFAPHEVPEDILCDMRKYYRKTQARDDIRIMSESFFLCQNTYDYDVFFSRLKLAQRCAGTLLQAKQAKCRCGIDSKVISSCEKVMASSWALKIDFLARTHDKEIDGAMKLKTPRGQSNRLNKYIQTLQEYETEFVEIEDEYNAAIQNIQEMIQEIKAGEV